MQATNTRLGSILIIISTLFYSTYGVWSKLMQGTFSEFTQAWTRALILLLVLLPIGFFMKSLKKIERKDWKWFAILGLASLNQAPYYFGFEHLSVGTATLLFYCFLTLGAYLIGALFFKEKMTLPKIIGLIIASIGLYNIYAFSLEPNQVFAAIATSLAGLMGACAVVFSKKVSDRYSELQIIVVYGVFILVGNLAMTLILDETMPKLALNTGWLAQVGYAVSFLLANATVVAGFRHIEPSVGGVLGLLEVVFAAILGVIIFSESVTLGLLIGGVLIVVGAVVPSLRGR